MAQTKHITTINLIFISLQLVAEVVATMVGGLRGLVKHLRSSTAVFVYVLALYFLLMVHQVQIGVLPRLVSIWAFLTKYSNDVYDSDGPDRSDRLDFTLRWIQLKI